MIRLSCVALAGLLLAGCVNWQESYDSAARENCNEVVNAEERQACLTQVEHNAREHREAQRS